LVALIVMLPIEVSALLDAVPGTADGYSRLVVIQPFDIALATIALLGLPGAVERLRRRDVGWGTGIMLLLLAGAVVSAVFTPTWRAAALILRLAGLFVTTSFITQLSPEDRRRFVVAPLLITVGVQALIGIAQMANRGPVGLSAWGERSAVDFRLLDGFVAIKGTMIHEYVLTGVAMLAATLGVVTATRIRPSRRGSPGSHSQQCRSGSRTPEWR
ncbi:MAG: hypothetical protein KJN71_00400, partial [Acidimicrobiia bacterium]|nr:hypothetical protein [Acidimicrobiia bacterium]